MVPFTRGPAPLPLTAADKVRVWTDSWIAGKPWSWHGTQAAIGEAAARDTDDHCAYCDRHIPYPRNVDHFRPKSQFRTEAYEWSNLFLCCPDGCNYTSGPFDESLVRPDDSTYRFEDFFLVNSNFELVAAEGPNKARAERVIAYRQLNKAGRSMAYRRMQAYKEQGDRPRNRRDFRFLWPEEAEAA